MARYLGGGFVPGIPARDLTGEEIALYGREMVEASGRYRIEEVEETEDKEDS